MMKDRQDIRRLVSRFFDGETTRDEERQLYRRFAKGDVPADLLPLREMMLDLRAAQPVGVAVNPASARRRPWLHRLATAAAVVLVVALSATLVFRQRDYCEMSVYGQRVTDREAVMREVNGTMTSLSEGSADVGGELRDLFGDKQ